MDSEEGLRCFCFKIILFLHYLHLFESLGSLGLELLLNIRKDFDDLIEIVFLQDIDDTKGLCLHKSLASSLDQNSNFAKVSSSTQA